MAFAEALSDDGSITGRGSPWLRRAVCGIMTAARGLGHSLPYLVPDLSNAFWIATGLAGIVVFFELWAIAFIRARLHGYAFPASRLPGGSRGRHRARNTCASRRILGSRPLIRLVRATFSLRSWCE